MVVFLALSDGPGTCLISFWPSEDRLQSLLDPF